MNKLRHSGYIFKIKILQPEFNKLYQKYRKKVKAFKKPDNDFAKGEILFPDNLIENLPEDIAETYSEFNFNFQNKKPIACMLLLRRIIPFSIIRKFQKLNKEDEIKKEGEYLGTESLLGKVEQILSSKRLYRELKAHKILWDSPQHIFTVKIQMTDVINVANIVRVFCEDLFRK